MAKLSTHEKAQLQSHSAIGHSVRFKERGGTKKEKQGIVVDEVSCMVGQHKQVLQRIRLEKGIRWDESEYAYRSGYYTFTDESRRLVWGQYSQLLTQKEFRSLLRKARNRGWAVFVA
jgi:hypothetical protein